MYAKMPWGETTDFTAVAEYIFYNAFAGSPQAFSQVLAVVFRGAYNQRNSYHFVPILHQCREQSVFTRLGELLRRLLFCSLSLGVLREVMLELETALLAVTGIGEFNGKEYLWHVILIHEMLTGQLSGMREHFKERSLFGNGGVDGLRLFYPLLTSSRIHDAATDLFGAFADLGLYLSSMHSLQWKLFLFQKSLNVAYIRSPPASLSIIKLPGQVKLWIRLLDHPHWPELCREINSFVLSDELKQFVESVRALQSMPRGLPSDITCRYCLGLSTKGGHAYWARLYKCYECVKKAQQRSITSFFLGSDH